MKFLILLLLAITASAAEFEDSGSGSGSGSTEFESFGSGEIQGSGYENEVKAEFENSESLSGSGSTEFESFGSGEIQVSGYENDVKESLCYGGQVFKQCGTLCPNVCGQEPAVFCIISCVIGCQCPDDMWLDSDGTCVAQEDCTLDTEIHNITPGYEQETITTSPMDTRDESHDLNCEQYEGHDDECHIRQAWTCQYTEWRLNFYTVWLKMFVEYRMYHEGSGMETPTCSVTEDMVNCANEGMKVCMSSSVLPDCPICYCADHVYQNVNELRDIWRTDYQEWSHLMKQWEEDASAANQHQNNDSSNHGECH